MIQVWTINFLIMRPRGRTEKSQNGQKHHRTKTAKDKNQNGQNPEKRKYFNTKTIKVYDSMITWYRCGQSTFSSCDHMDGQRKAKMDKSTIGQKHQRIKIKAYKTQKRENILILQQSRCTIPLITWSKCGQSTFSSCDHVGGQRKAKNGQKHHITKAAKDKNQRG